MHVDAVGATQKGTASNTMADMLSRAASKYASRPALRYSPGEGWNDLTYSELGKIVKEVSLGLCDLGIGKGDRVAILSNTRPEWTFANFAIACSQAATVSIYQTNSPEECRYVLEHSDARCVFCEDAEQLEKIDAVRGELPSLEHVVVMDADGASGAAISLDELRNRGRTRTDEEFDQRVAAVSPEDPFLYIYTSGTTGPPKGCILTHKNYRQVLDMVESRRGLEDEDEVVYLFLPLAHAFALLIQLAVVDLGGTLAYWRRDPQKIVSDLMEVAPTYFPSIPRVFEKIYTLATANAPDRAELDRAIQVGFEVRMMRERGEEVPPELEQAFDRGEEAVFKNVRALFGGRLRQAVSGAAPIAAEILKFFYACGVVVLEGYGLTETSTVAISNSLDEFRFGSVGKPLAGVEARVADDGELILRGSNIFSGYHKDTASTQEVLEADGWFHTGDLAYIDDDGFVYITGRKKDIIITAGGKNITPANIENALKQNRWVSQAIVVGDRRPYLGALITLDPEETPAFADRHGLAPDAVASSDELRQELQAAIDEINAQLGRVEQIKRFKVLEQDLSQQAGELTPTLKVKRRVVTEKYADEIDQLYQD